MTIQTWLRQTQNQLQIAGIGTARLDALVLLEDVTGKDRGWLLAHPELELPAAQLQKLKKLFKRRISHEPLAYIRGRTEFYGREFVLTPAVLEPRPESETMIDLLKELIHGRAAGLSSPSKLRIADVGTGSGALGITAALELPQAKVDLLEIDAKAIKVAQMNVDKFTLSIVTKQSDLLSQGRGNYDVLLCNLPYVPDDYHINLSAGHEPRLAIFGGPDGLDVYRRLFDQIVKLKIQPLYILSESLPPQHSRLATLAEGVGYKLKKTADFIQLFVREL